MEKVSEGTARRRTLRYGGLLALILAVKWGGTLALAQFGLGWRCWLDSGLTVAAVVLALLAACWLDRWMADSELLPGWLKWPAVILCALGAVFLAAVFLYWFLLFGSFTDRVTEYEGQKVVAEYTGIFEETGYRYVNWFVHGEAVYVWQDYGSMDWRKRLRMRRKGRRETFLSFADRVPAGKD